MVQRSTSRFLPSFTFAALAVLVLTGCGATASDSDLSVDAQSDTQPADATSNDDAPADSSGDGGEVTLSYGDTTYTAQLQFCSLQEGQDALFHGLAYDDSGQEVGYLDGDFGNLSDVPHGEARIDFGATGQFQSTDEFIAIGDAAGHYVVTGSSDTGLVVIGGLQDQDGTQLSTATLMVNC